MNDVARAPRMLDSSDRVALVRASGALARVAFAVVIVLSPFRARFVLADRDQPPIYGDFTDLLVTWTDVAVIATLGLWAIDLRVHRRPISLGPAFIRWPVSALLVVMWVASATSIDRGLSLWYSLRATVLAALAIFVLNEIRDLGRVVPAVIAMIVVQAFVAIGQVLAQRSIGWSALGEHPLDPSTGISVVTSLDGDRFLRAYGLTDHPNILGGLLVFGLVVVVGGLHRADERARAVALAAVAFGAIAAALTFSRSAGLALVLAAAFAVLALALGRHIAALRWWLAAGLVGVVAVVMLFEPYGKYFEVRSDTESIAQVATEQRSLDERAALVEVTNEIIVDRPFLGTGLGTMPQAIADREPEFAFDYQPAHVVLLDVAAELGILGAAAYTIVLVGPWIALWIRRSNLDASLVAASALVGAITVVGLFDYYTWTNPAGLLWFWIGIGLWCGAYATPSKAGKRG